MIIDKALQFSDAQAVTSTAISEVIDLGDGNTLRDIGIGEDLWLVIITQTTCTDSGSDATVTFSLESDSVAALSSATVHYTSGAKAFAAYATAGTENVAIRLPAGNYERYLGVRYTVASGPLTAGAFDAFLVRDYDKSKNYAHGYTF